MKEEENTRAAPPRSPLCQRIDHMHTPEAGCWGPSDEAEVQAFIQQMADEYNSLAEAAQRLVRGEYRPWETSGGAEECGHGYNLGIDCRKCDLALVFEHKLRTGNADASPPPDSSAALREARRLLGEAREHLHVPDRPHTCHATCLAVRIDAFLGEQNGKGSGGSNSIDAPTKEER